MSRSRSGIGDYTRNELEQIGKGNYMRIFSREILHIIEFCLTLTVLTVTCVFLTLPVKAEAGSGTAPGGCPWMLTDEGELIIGEDGGTWTFGPLTNTTDHGVPWYADRADIKSVRFRGTVNGRGYLGGMFYGCENLTSVKGVFHTENVTSMSVMFSSCVSLTDIEALADWNTGKVTDLYGMFYNCRSLSDISSLSGWNTGNVTRLSYLFYGCSSLSGTDSLSGWSTGKVTAMNYMFYKCASLPDLDGLMSWNTGKVTDMSNMFLGCTSLADPGGLTGWNTENVTNMGYAFYGCSSLRDVTALSGWNTGKVTDMHYMFSGCGSISDISALSGWNTGKVTTFQAMFSGCGSISEGRFLSGWNTANATDFSFMFSECRNLKKLDISGFNTGKATSMYKMFNGCTELREIILGENFKCKGRNITNQNYQAILPTPPSSVTTGRWIREDGVYGPFTPAQLRDSYTADMAGTWVWQLKNTVAVINFDADGGYTETAAVTQTAPFRAVEFPEAVRPGYILIGWNMNRDGGGTTYRPGTDPDNVFTPKGGQYITFYALWGMPTEYTVKHFQQNLSLTGYDLSETEVYSGISGDTVSPEVRIYDGFTSPDAQTVTLSANGGTTVEYRYDREKYTIHFDGNGASEGIMNDRFHIRNVSQRLSDNRYKKDSHVFTGWNTQPDGSGSGYGDAQSVRNLAGNGETVILYAQWLDVSSARTEASEGVFTVRIHAGETITIPELPAGTHYSITEKNNPSGWIQDSSDSAEGVIAANEKASAVIRNTYSAEGSITLRAYKCMQDAELTGGEFTFELIENDRVIQTAENGTADNAEQILTEEGRTAVNPFFGMSTINFETITYTEAGIHTYRIREQAGDSEDIRYDGHEETVTVTVTDMKNGLLSCAAEYDRDGPVFTNSRIPKVEWDRSGTLAVTKTVSNMESDQEFTFRVTLSDAEGTELADSYAGDVILTDVMEAYGEDDVIQHIYGEEAVIQHISLASGGTVVLKSGQTAVIKEIPAGTVFKVEETDIPEGFEQVYSEETEGVVSEDTLSEASFRNVYNAEGCAQFTVSKVLSGGEIQEKQFRFVLKDSEGNILQEVCAETNGSVAFAPVFYTQDDADKTFRYSIHEEKGAEREILYDEHVVDVRVAVTDTGRGSLETEVSYEGDRMFVNRMRRRLIVPTSADTNVNVMIFITAAALTAAGGAYAHRKKKNTGKQ